jgi:hypothetical protein
MTVKGYEERGVNRTEGGIAIEMQPNITPPASEVIAVFRDELNISTELVELSIGDTVRLWCRSIEMAGS